ncbi:MAG TPA: ABC transporter ATP-binding protein [Candidatus Acidoferrum sp.]|nr:ABC transporter ATP-binding protein [Candidatus Acidoferrum sp.]
MANVELRGLTKRYGENTVVDGVDLAIPDGAFVCLLGPSGCGKTTLLRLLAGFVAPDAGQIDLGGTRVSAPGAVVPPERRGMSMIFQSYALWPHLTVEQNIAYGLRLRKVARDEIERRLETICAATKLEGLRTRYPGELSGGQQQRVALARALVVEPQTLLLDEPLSNLDANLREEMRFEIRRLHDAFRYTTVYVTHDQSEAMATADLIVVLNAGRVEQAGTPEEIALRPRSEFVARFVGGTNVIPGSFVGRPGTVAIRLEDVGLFGARPDFEGNVAEGTVVRRVFLGGARDYVVETGGEQIRVTAPLSVDVPLGERVWLYFPPERCRALESAADGGRQRCRV